MALGWMARKLVLVDNINYTGRPLHPIKNSPARNFIREELKWYYQEQYHSKHFKFLAGFTRLLLLRLPSFLKYFAELAAEQTLWLNAAWYSFEATWAG